MRGWATLGLWAGVWAGCGDPPEEEDDGTGLVTTDPDAILRDATVTTVASWDAAGAAAGFGAWTEVVVYDADGRIVRDTWDADDDSDDIEQTWQRRDDGQVLSWTVDFGLDGTIDFSESRTYDDDGVLLSRERDSNGDGTVDELAEYLSEGGLPVEELVDLDADGAPDTRLTYRYDDRGRQISSDRDDRLDGSVDAAARWSWFGGTDLLQRYTFDEGNEGLVDYDEEHWYDGSARELRSVVSDRGRTGINDDQTFVYEDGDPHPDSGTWIRTVDGELLQVVQMTFSWDDDGRELGTVWAYAPDEGAPVDAVLTSEVTWTY